MPTGYTLGIAEGEITTLQQFALKCARAFGPLMSMRDAPHDAEVPKILESSRYELENLQKAKAHLASILAMSEAEIEQKIDAEIADERRCREAAIAKDLQARTNYERLISQVKAWQVPGELDGLRQFMLEQLEQDYKYDFAVNLTPEDAPRLSIEEWRKINLESAENNVKRAQREWDEEVALTARRNDWLAKLFESLVDPSAETQEAGS